MKAASQRGGFVSIRTRVIVSSQLVMVTVVVLGALATYVSQSRALESDFEERSEKIVQIAALGLADDAWNLDHEGAQRTVDAFFGYPEVLSAVVADKGGRILANQRRSGPAESDALTLTKDILYAGQPVATLTVVFSRNLIGVELLQSMTSFLLLMVVLTVGTFVGNALAVSRILRPLRSLVQAIDDFGEGRVIPAVSEPGTRDEISQVYRRFLLMSELVETKNQTVHELAYFDTLTGLPNRLQTYSEVTKRIEAARGFRLSIVDIDNFRVINDTFGMATGDLVLKEIGGRLRSVCRERNWWAGRLGDDEFLVIAADLSPDRDPPSDHLSDLLSGFYSLPNVNQWLSVSVGHSWFPRDGEGIVEVLRATDTALLTAKSSGKSCERAFTREMGRNLETRRLLETELAQALERQEFHLEFQPQYSTECQCVTSFESLLRWNNRTLGSVPPSEFIPIAERTGVIVPIGYWVLEKSFEFIQNLSKAGHPDIDISVNLSSVQIMEQDLVDQIGQTVGRMGIDPARVVLEVTESVFIQNFQKVSATIEGLRNLGFRLSLDDFGTGYSSLSYLREIRFDELKIDRAFLARTAEDAASREIFKSIVGLATGLGMSLVVEGVEHPTQFQFCESHGCHKIQGYLLSRPLPADRVRPFLTQQNWLSWGQG